MAHHMSGAPLVSIPSIALFLVVLPKFRFVSQKLKPYGNDMKKPCACKICGEIGQNHKEHKDKCPNCEGSDLAEESQLGRSLISYVKGLPTTLLSVTFTPWFEKPSSRRKKQ